MVFYIEMDENNSGYEWLWWNAKQKSYETFEFENSDLGVLRNVCKVEKMQYIYNDNKMSSQIVVGQNWWKCYIMV